MTEVRRERTVEVCILVAPEGFQKVLPHSGRRWRAVVFSTIIFTYLSDVIIKWWDKLKDKWVTKKGPKKHFTKANRRIIKVKHRFGLVGIAALTPVLLSIPLGAFLAERFYKDKKKVILYTAISLLVWANIYYFILVFGKKAIEAIIHFF